MSEIVESRPSKDDCNLAMLAHLLGVFTGFIGALVIWLIKKEESPFVAQEAKEALNFQITMGIAFFCSWVLIFIMIGLLVMPVLFFSELYFFAFSALFRHQKVSLIDILLRSDWCHKVQLSSRD